MAELTGKFHDDIQESACLTGLDLSAWLSPTYAESLGPARHLKRVGIAA